MKVKFTKETQCWLVLICAMAVLAYFGYNFLHFKQPIAYLAVQLVLPVLILAAIRRIGR